MSVHLVAACGDIHAGSTTALCPPEGFELDDGGVQLPNKLQRWLWERWEAAWAEYGRVVDDLRPDSQTLILNGDLVDGIHHQSPQVAPLVGQHFRAAHELLKRGPLAYKPDAVHVVRGTESHVGRAGELEEGLARALQKQEGVPIVEDPDTGQATSYWRRLEIDGVRLDLRHHGRMGQRAHTRGPYSRWYAQDIELEHYLDGEPAPHLALRSHLHKYMDSGLSHRWTTRVVSLPCWQMMTAYAHRITAESLSDIGIVLFTIKDGRLGEPNPILFPPDRPTVLRTA